MDRVGSQDVHGHGCTRDLRSHHLQGLAKHGVVLGASDAVRGPGAELLTHLVSVGAAHAGAGAVVHSVQ